MSSSQDAIKRVVEAFERSNWSEIDVRSGNLRVHLATSAAAGVAPAASDRVVVEPDPPAAETHRPATGAHIVVSPSPGILWRSPEPGAPPFADVGHTLDASATVCIVEVMKLMNHVKAGVSGEVVAVYGQNGVAVQRGQPLFAIVASESP